MLRSFNKNVPFGGEGSMTVIRNALKASLAGMLFAGLLSSAAAAQDKPAELKIAITTFLSGPASVFGVPGKNAAEMIAEDINKKGGILGVPVKLSFIDEGAGGEALVSNYRRVVQDEKVDVTFASISSGSCNQLVPLAEDLKVLNLMWDCGASSILEAKKYRYSFRTQANATQEMMAVLIYSPCPPSALTTSSYRVGKSSRPWARCVP